MVDRISSFEQDKVPSMRLSKSKPKMQRTNAVLPVKNAAADVERALGEINLSGRVKRYWEIVADNLSKAGWSWGCVSAIDSNGRTISDC